LDCSSKVSCNGCGSSSGTPKQESEKEKALQEKKQQGTSQKQAASAIITDKKDDEIKELKKLSKGCRLILRIIASALKGKKRNLWNLQIRRQ
jgi:hypothetical protein